METNNALNAPNTNAFATLAVITAQKAPYALQVEGNALAPLVRHGELVKVSPICCRDSAHRVKPGILALVAVATSRAALCRGDYFRHGLYRLNAKGEAVAGKSKIPARCFVVLGVAEPYRPN